MNKDINIALEEFSKFMENQNDINELNHIERKAHYKIVKDTFEEILSLHRCIRAAMIGCLFNLGLILAHFVGWEIL